MPTRSRRKLKTARLIIHPKFTELTMLGFEIEDLDVLKSTIDMRWDKDDRVWLVHRFDVDLLIETLEDNGFVIRSRQAEQ